MRTKQEVISFLESKVGTKVKCVGNPSLDGQCVTLIKSLMEFLGVPEPYKARGNAKAAISAYLSEGIADNGAGFLSVFSNKDMGGGYGHIWCNAGDGDGVFYESNGVKPLIVTKGKTYSYDTVCNFDKYIKGDSMADIIVDSKTYEMLVTKATKYDEIIKTGYISQDQHDSIIAQKEGDIAHLGKQVVALEKQITDHVCPTDQTVDMNKWELNGMEVQEGNKTFNYKLK